MSIHRSLYQAGKLKRHRNVLTRAERLDVLQREERWKDEDSIYGLPKVRNIMVRAKKKVKKKTDEEETEAAAETGEEAAKS